jgi:hypothetical protein
MILERRARTNSEKVSEFDVKIWPNGKIESKRDISP